MEIQYAVLNAELVLRKLECLVNQINLLVFHFSKVIKSDYIL